MPSSERIESVFSRRSGTERTEEAGASTVGENDNTLCVPFETEEMVVEINPDQVTPGETDDVVDPPQEGNIMDDSAIRRSAMTVAEELENSNDPEHTN